MCSGIRSQISPLHHQISHIITLLPLPLLLYRCGRGGFCNSHEGNKNWRRLVSANKELYVALPKFQKQLLSQSIVHAVQTQNPPGRFLMRDGTTNRWYPIDDLKAIEKTSQALREGGVQVRETLETERGIQPDSMDLLSSNANCTNRVVPLPPAELAMSSEQMPSSINIYMPSVNDAARISAPPAVEPQQQQQHYPPTPMDAYGGGSDGGYHQGAPPPMQQQYPPYDQGLSGLPSYPPEHQNGQALPMPYPPDQQQSMGMEPYYPHSGGVDASTAAAINDERASEILQAAIAAHHQAHPPNFPQSEAVVINIPNRPAPQVQGIITSIPDMTPSSPSKPSTTKRAKKGTGSKKQLQKKEPSSFDAKAAPTKQHTPKVPPVDKEASPSTAAASTCTREVDAFMPAPDLSSLEQPSQSMASFMKDLIPNMTDPLDKPMTSISSNMSTCTPLPLPPDFQTSFSSMSLGSTAKRFAMPTTRIDKNAPTFAGHERSHDDLIDGSDDEDDDDGGVNNGADWEKMRAVFGIKDSDMPREISHETGTNSSVIGDLCRDISGMSTISMGDFALERSPSSTVMRDITIGSLASIPPNVKQPAARDSAQACDAASKGDDSNLSEQEKIEKFLLGRGRSLVYEQFGSPPKAKEKSAEH